MCYNLMNLMKARGVNNRRLASKLDVTEKTVGNKLNGKNFFTSYEMYTIMDILSIDRRDMYEVFKDEDIF